MMASKFKFRFGCWIIGDQKIFLINPKSQFKRHGDKQLGSPKNLIQQTKLNYQSEAHHYLGIQFIL